MSPDHRPSPMAAAATCMRTVFRSSTSFRSSAAKISQNAKTSRSTFSRLTRKNPNPPRFLRSPVQMSCCVETLLPLHSATASAVLTSMLVVSRRSYGWLSEAPNNDL